jgi:hypothetical protein
MLVGMIAASCEEGGNVYDAVEAKAKRWLEAKGYKVEKAGPDKSVMLNHELEDAKKRILDLEDRINQYNQATKLLREA